MIALKPKMLYYYGKLPEKRVPTVAIVGARKQTAYGEEVAYRAAYAVAKMGAVVVSGLAYGIDSVAHRGALDAGGITIAVLGTPIDRIYPMRNVGLAREIVDKGGAIMSEYGPGETGGGHGEQGGARFLYRNRIIAGLSDAVFVAEAAEHSGSLNTAAHALEQGKDVYAAPADITRVNSEGCNRLIQKGAYPYMSPADILERLFPGRSSARRSSKKAQLAFSGGTELERRILGEISKGVRDGGEIVERLGVSAAEFNQAITMLELSDMVKALGMNRWTLK